MVIIEKAGTGVTTEGKIIIEVSVTTATAGGMEDETLEAAAPMRLQEATTAEFLPGLSVLSPA